VVLRGLVAALLAGSAAAESVTEAGDVWSAEIALSDEAARWPALDALLRDTARAALDDFAAEATETVQPGDRPWSLWIADEILFASDRHASVRRVTSFDTGGAHPNHAVAAQTWDATTGDFTGLDAWIDRAAAGPAIADRLRAEIARAVHGGTVDEFWKADVEAAIGPEGLAAVTLVPSTAAGRAAGIDVHFSPYEVGPYAAGTPVVRVDWRLFEGALTEEGRALFGGEAAGPVAP
jgi:hypothetical protein